MKKLKYFLDTEFIEKPNTIELISIGIKCEDGRKYYAISSEYDYSKASDWVKNNIILDIFEESKKSLNITYEEMLPSLTNIHKFVGKKISEIKGEILEFVGYPNYEKGKPEFWGYYSDYDWVVFCWIFGAMIDLPEGFPMYCKDLKQLADESNKPKFYYPSKEHNALEDAIWNHEFYKYLKE